MPERELLLAGHPTLGSCHAWLSNGGVKKRADRIVQECGAGLISIAENDSSLAFAAPPLLRTGPVEETTLQEIADVLNLWRSQVKGAQWADNEPGWIVILLESAEAVLAVEPARECAMRLDVGIIGPYPPGSETAFELRAFYTDLHGALREDPVTGSLNGSAAQWLPSTGLASAPYVASQGARVGCSGRVYIRQDGSGQVWVGGRTQTLFSGICRL